MHAAHVPEGSADLDMVLQGHVRNNASVCASVSQHGSCTKCELKVV